MNEENRSNLLESMYKDCLRYIRALENKIEQLQDENKELIEILKTIRQDINFPELCDGYIILDKLKELEGGKND